MKAVLILCALVLVCGSAFAQDGSIVVFGPRFAEGGEYAISYGYATPLTGGLWGFTYGDAGSYASWANEVMYLFPVSPKLFLGPVAGPNADFQVGQDEVTYIAGAGGIVAAFRLSDKIGIAALAKYKFKVENDVFYKNGWLAGAGLYVRL